MRADDSIRRSRRTRWAGPAEPVRGQRVTLFPAETAKIAGNSRLEKGRKVSRDERLYYANPGVPPAPAWVSPILEEAYDSFHPRDCGPRSDCVRCPPSRLSSAPPTAAGPGDERRGRVIPQGLVCRAAVEGDLQVRGRLAIRVSLHAARAHGLPLKEMSEAQRAKAQALVKTGLSMRGYTTATTIIGLENVLKAIEPPRTGPNAIVRDPELYFVSIYGTPGKSAMGLEVRRPPRRLQLHHRRRQAHGLCAELLRRQSRAGGKRARRKARARCVTRKKPGAR